MLYLVSNFFFTLIIERNYNSIPSKFSYFQYYSETDSEDLYKDIEVYSKASAEGDIRTVDDVDKEIYNKDCILYEEDDDSEDEKQTEV
ncbi:30204_t:CDS:1, partial [Racocetra persica]